MNHLTALVLKALINGGILLILLPLTGRVLVGGGVTVAVVLVILAYVLGDLWILPQFGNVAAVVADFGLAWLVLMGANLVFPRAIDIAPVPALLVAAVIAAGEWGFHLLLQRRGVGAAQERPE